jgi:D-alanyl-D-alanine carboxypeptidase
LRRLTLIMALSLAALTLPSTAWAASSCGAGAKRASGGGDVCISRTDKRGAKVLSTVRAVRTDKKTLATIFGVWDGSKLLAGGALGRQMPGVPATRNVSLRVSNVLETMVSTLLLEMVDDGKIKLSDKLSRWYPRFPRASQITVGMLARMTSGIADYVTDKPFVDANNADPFRFWSPDQLLTYVPVAPVFAPGKSWAFSDTNYVLLSSILTKVGHASLGTLIQRGIAKPLGLRNTRVVTTGAMPSPTLHTYSAERGPYEETTYWNPTWGNGTGNLISDLRDLSVWTRALGTGRLLSRTSAKLQTGTINVGLGPLTTTRRYALGVGVAGGWVTTNPQMPGFNGIIGYLPKKHLSVVVWSSMTAANSPTISYSTYFLLAIAKKLTGTAPPLNPNPRPDG